MKKVYYVICIFILATFFIASPIFSSQAAETNSTISELKIEISSYELYVYSKDEMQISEFENYLKENSVVYEKTLKEGNSAVHMYTLKNQDISKAYENYEKALEIIKSDNTNAVVNLSARGSVNEDTENIYVTKAICVMLNFTPKNVLENETFYEADGNGKIGDKTQEMQIAVRKSENNGFTEFFIGIPSVLNEY